MLIIHAVIPDEITTSIGFSHGNPLYTLSLIPMITFLFIAFILGDVDFLNGNTDKIKYAINCYNNDLAWWIKHRFVDWLVDDKVLTKENTILISEHPLDPRYEFNGYPDEMRTISRVAEKRPRWMPKYLWWRLVHWKYPNLKNIIFCNTYGLQSFYRNQDLRWMGIRSWLYFHSTNASFMWYPLHNIPKVTLFQHLNYDHILCWNEHHKLFCEYHTEPACGIKVQYHIIGAPFADYAYQNRTEKTIEPNTTIFYDTSFGHSFTPTDLYVDFLDTIVEYKRRFPKKDVYLKLKKPMFHGQAAGVDVPYHLWKYGIDNYVSTWNDTTDGQIKKLFSIMNSEGVKILRPDTNNDELLLKAGNIIAMPYTSIAIEAASAGVPVEWWGTDKKPKDYASFTDGKTGDRIRKLLINEE